MTFAPPPERVYEDILSVFSDHSQGRSRQQIDLYMDRDDNGEFVCSGTWYNDCISPESRRFLSMFAKELYSEPDGRELFFYEGLGGVPRFMLRILATTGGYISLTGKDQFHIDGCTWSRASILAYIKGGCLETARGAVYAVVPFNVFVAMQTGEMNKSTSTGLSTPQLRYERLQALPNQPYMPESRNKPGRLRRLGSVYTHSKGAAGNGTNIVHSSNGVAGGPRQSPCSLTTPSR